MVAPRLVKMTLKTSVSTTIPGRSTVSATTAAAGWAGSTCFLETVWGAGSFALARTEPEPRSAASSQLSGARWVGSGTATEQTRPIRPKASRRRFSMESSFFSPDGLLKPVLPLSLSAMGKCLNS